MPTPESPLPAGPRTPAVRDDGYDLVKGFLVVMMVVYHAMNVVSTASVEAFGWVRFVSGSFIFVTGLLIARFVAPGWDVDRVGTSRKLVSRGLKLVVLFTVLNLVIHASGFGSPAKQQVGALAFLSHAYEVYVLGDARWASFVILLPIGYLLILAPVLLALIGPSRRGAGLLVLLVVLALAALPRQRPGSLVAEFLVIGITGYGVGAWTNGRLMPSRAGFAGLPRRLIAFAGLAASIGLTSQLYLNLTLYAISVWLVIGFAYECAIGVDATRWPASILSLLGRCSLFAYIAQIALIQLSARAWGRPQWPLGLDWGLFTVVMSVLLVAACACLSWIRHRSRHAEWAYRFVFA